jgi:hypothetical protein
MQRQGLVISSRERAGFGRPCRTPSRDGEFPKVSPWAIVDRFCGACGVMGAGNTHAEARCGAKPTGPHGLYAINVSGDRHLEKFSAFRLTNTLVVASMGL